ncbi:MAG: hypothetical protein V4671_24275, partial [Armatimonadota bacterium]
MKLLPAAAVPPMGWSVLAASAGFGLASLCVFATVAFAERWMYQRLGMTGAYLAWTTLFILLGGTALRPLVRSVPAGRFYLIFALGFFVYAVGWIGAYFTLRGTVGEWAGSLVGSMLMAFIFAAGFRARHSALRLAVVLFIANSVGYFAGSAVNNAVDACAPTASSCS